jgi:hypothetical protein
MVVRARGLWWVPPTSGSQGQGPVVVDNVALLPLCQEYACGVDVPQPGTPKWVISAWTWSWHQHSRYSGAEREMMQMPGTLGCLRGGDRGKAWLLREG